MKEKDIRLAFFRIIILNDSDHYQYTLYSPNTNYSDFYILSHNPLSMPFLNVEQLFNIVYHLVIRAVLQSIYMLQYSANIRQLPYNALS